MVLPMTVIYPNDSLPHSPALYPSAIHDNEALIAAFLDTTAAYLALPRDAGRQLPIRPCPTQGYTSQAITR